MHSQTPSVESKGSLKWGVIAAVAIPVGCLVAFSRQLDSVLFASLGVGIAFGVLSAVVLHLKPPFPIKTGYPKVGMLLMCLVFGIVMAFQNEAASTIGRSMLAFLACLVLCTVISIRFAV